MRSAYSLSSRGATRVTVGRSAVDALGERLCEREAALAAEVDVDVMSMSTVFGRASTIGLIASDADGRVADTAMPCCSSGARVSPRSRRCRRRSGSAEA
jgi:hypothetical protein